MIDGDQLLESEVDVWNVRHRLLELEIVLSGCGCDDRSMQVIEVPPFSRRSFTLITDPSHLSVGKQSASIRFRGLIGDEPFETSHEYSFTVKRRITD